MSYLYGINPPKITENNILLFKELRVYRIIDGPPYEISKILLYDLEGNYKEEGFEDINILDSFKIREFSLIEPSKLQNSLRELWVFRNQELAFYQKIICLKTIRDIFNQREIEQIKTFNESLTPQVEVVYEKIKETNPELFL